jgi:two-component system CheB/CheR fusion protein
VTGAGHAGVDAALHDLVQAYVPFSMLVSSHRQLLHAWGPTDRFLRLQPGQVNLDAIRLLPARLGAVVGHAMQRALRERRSCTAPALWLELGGERLNLRVAARPLPDDTGPEPLVIISIEVLADGAVTGPAERPMDDTELDRLAALERELSETRLTLQASIEELEAANEELQATNEELMSSNEELQSTNEELQSVNEELYTVNAEYNAKLDLVSALHADLEGMSQATGIATLFVDHALNLVRFTPEATLLFRLRPDDVGRAITDFKCQIDYPGLADDLRQVLAGRNLIERELPGPAHSRFLARVVGYGGNQARTRRAVLSLVDISRLHDAERMQRLIDSLPEHIALLDGQGVIRQINQGWREFAHANADERQQSSLGVGANYLGVLARSTSPDAPAVLAGLQRVLSGQQEGLRVTYPCHSPAEQRWFVMQVSPLKGSGQGEAGAVVTHMNITPWVLGHTPDSEMGS